MPPSSKTDSKSLEEWINSNIDDTVLSELSRLTRTDIARLSKTQVCWDVSLFIHFTNHDLRSSYLVSIMIQNRRSLTDQKWHGGFS